MPIYLYDIKGFFFSTVSYIARGRFLLSRQHHWKNAESRPYNDEADIT